MSIFKKSSTIYTLEKEIVRGRNTENTKLAANGAVWILFVLFVL